MDDIQRKKDVMKCEIERTLGYPVISTPDFKSLSDAIMEKTREYVSPTTLKRFWGKYEGHHSPRPSIWNALARFVGDSNMGAFERRMRSVSADISGEVSGSHLLSEDFRKDTELELTWYPDRRIVIKHLGEGRYRILSVENSHLKVGGEFSAGTFIEGKPLLLESYRTGDNGEIIHYEIGRSGGIYFKLLDL